MLFFFQTFLFCVCQEWRRERKKENFLPVISLISFTQFNKNVILKLKNCGWNNKLNKSRFHLTSSRDIWNPQEGKGKHILAGLAMWIGCGKMHTRENEAIPIIICIKYCVIRKRFKDIFPLLLSLKKPLKKKYAVESKKNVFTLSYGGWTAS